MGNVYKIPTLVKFWNVIRRYLRMAVCYHNYQHVTRVNAPTCLDTDKERAIARFHAITILPFKLTFDIYVCLKCKDVQRQEIT